MADNVLFEVDASQIIAKMHFAGLEATREGYDSGAFFVNTGIKNDNPMGKPNDIGKTRFDLTNKTGEYQFGWIKPIVYEYTKGDYSAVALKDDIKTYQSYLASVETSGVLDKQSKKEKDKSDAIKKNIQVACKKLGLDEPTEYTSDSLDELIKAVDNAKNIKDGDQASTSNKSFIDMYDDAKAKSFKLLKNYMRFFAGVDNAKFDENQVGVMQVANGLKGPNDKNLVKAFEIQPISPQEKGKVEAEAKANPKEATKTFCFYVKYSLNVEK